jgi:rfaE bifunctional protein nucleotidyltransferase chain/domain
MIIDNLDLLEQLINKIKSKNKKIGLLHGVFDLLHSGHILHFNEAKKYCDELIISITSDKYVNKGPGRPALTQAKRLEIVNSIKGVNYVYLNNEETSEKLIKRIKPNYYIKGPDYSKNNDLTKNLSREKKAINSVGGKMIFTKDLTFSSTKILKKNFDILNKDNFYMSNKNIDYQKIIKNFNYMSKRKINCRILIIGEPIIDCYNYVKILGKSAKSNILTTTASSYKEYSGGSFLIANILSKFLKNVEIFHFENKTNHYKFLNKDIKSIKIASNNLIKKDRFIDKYNSQKLFQINTNDNFVLTVKNQDKIIKYINNNYRKFDLIVVTDFGHGLFSEKIVNYINSLKKVKFAINCQTNSYNYGFNLISKYKKKFIACVDEIEFRLTVKNQNKPIEDLIKENLKFIRQYKYFVITVGKKGSYTIHNSKINFFPSVIKSSEDTTGCGDVYFSLLIILILSKKLNLDEISLISNISAGYHATEVGNDHKKINPEFLLRLFQYF